MSVTGAMVDKLRTRRIELVDKRDGESRRVPVFGPWIKCRLAPPTTRERMEDANTGYERDFTVIINKRDVDGNDVDIENGDYVEIDSVVFGKDDSEDENANLYDIVGEIEPIRSRRKLIMYRASLKKRTTR